MSKPNKASAFLQAMSVTAEPVTPPATANDASLAPRSRPASRNGLKHIGGYFNRADVEKFAVLRARLDLDNSELIKMAIDELYKKHEAKRAFGDV